MIVGTTGIGCYFFTKDEVNEVRLSLIILSSFYNVIFMEIFFSNFSVMNMTHDREFSTKQIMIANRISPIIYYCGKLVLDLLIQFFIFGTLFLIIYLSLSNYIIQFNYVDLFIKQCVIVSFWKISFFFQKFETIPD